MNFLMNLQPAALLAQGRIEAMNQGFRMQQHNSYASIIMITIVLLALGTAAGIFFYVKRKSQKVVDDPLQLFRELSRAHGLSGGQRKLLLQLAKNHGLKDPCTLFLDSAHFSLDPQADANLCQPKSLKKFLFVQRIIFTEEQKAAAA